MIVGDIYRKYFKNNLFMKIILFFSVVMILTIITFSYLMYRVMSEAAVQRQMDVQKARWKAYRITFPANTSPFSGCCATFIVTGSWLIICPILWSTLIRIM